MRVKTIHYLKRTYLGDGVFRPIICKHHMRQTLFPHLQVLLQYCSQHCRQCSIHVAEPPKRLGPGALIFIAEQLEPKSACTSSSSSEASIKATLFQDRADNTHTKVRPEITTQNISYISEWLQWKINLLQTEFRIVKYYRVQLLKLLKSHCFSGKITREKKWRIDKDRTKASLSGRVVSTGWRTIPLNRPARRQSTRPSKTRNHILEVST